MLSLYISTYTKSIKENEILTQNYVTYTIPYAIPCSRNHVYSNVSKTDIFYIPKCKQVVSKMCDNSWLSRCENLYFKRIDYA